MNTAFVAGIAPEYLHSYASHYVNVNPWMDFWKTAPPGRVFISERDAPARHFRDTEFYVDWLAPQANMEAASGTRIEVGQTDAVHVAWHYGVAHAATYDAAAASLLEKLRPDFEAAVRDEAMVREALGSDRRVGVLIDHIQGAAFVVDRNLGVVEANARAEAELLQGTALQAFGNVLSVREPTAHKWIESTTQRLVDQMPVASTSRVFSIGPRVYRLNLSLLPSRTMSSSVLLVPPQPAVLVVMALLVGGEVRLDHDAVKVAFGLSDAETRLCDALVKGLSLRDAARAFGLSDGTVRQRVKIIFHKTRTHRQGELIAALNRFVSSD